MKLSNVGYINYKFLDGTEKSLSVQDLKTLGTEKQKGKIALKNMEFFLVKVLKELQGVLKEEGNYCELEFVRQTDSAKRKTEGSGRFTITGKGPIEGPVLLNQFKAAFNL